MKVCIIPITAVLTTLCMGLTGCVTPGVGGPGLAGLPGPGFLGAGLPALRGLPGPGLPRPGLPGLPGAPSISHAAVAAIVTAVVISVIAKRQASERQRIVAEQRGKRAIARMPAKRKAELKKSKVRYVAVETERDAKTSPNAKKTIALVDVESETVVGNRVYDIQEKPRVGQVVQFDGKSAEYAGSGG